jgi:membrane-bound inhibitor of C-type lysozyme
MRGHRLALGIAGGVAATLAACVAAPPPRAEPAPSSYVCANGRYFAVNYGQEGETPSVTLTFENDERALLLAEPSASGARYGWPSDGTGYVFWSKGQEAMVLLKDGTKGGKETVLYADCRLQ